MSSNQRLILVWTIGPCGTDGRLNPVLVRWFPHSAKKSLEFYQFHLFWIVSNKTTSYCTCVFQRFFFSKLTNKLPSNLQQDFLHVRRHLWLPLHQGAELNIPSYYEHKVSIYFPSQALLPLFCRHEVCEDSKEEVFFQAMEKLAFKKFNRTAASLPTKRCCSCG